MITSSYICRVKRPDGIHVRLEVIAPSHHAAMKYAIGGLKGASVSCREKDDSEYTKPMNPFVPVIKGHVL